MIELIDWMCRKLKSYSFFQKWIFAVDRMSLDWWLNKTKIVLLFVNILLTKKNIIGNIINNEDSF